MRKHGRRRRRLRPMTIILFGVMALSVTLVLQPPAGGQNGAAPGQSPPVQPTATTESPLDEPLRLLYEARRYFAGVKDYTCTLQTRENVRGALQDENVMMCKMRTQPFSVYMRWLAPKKAQGQEVCFVAGRNNNKMRVHSTVLGGKIAGFVSVDTTDKRVFDHSRHTIHEAGLGNLIEQTIKAWEFERQVGKTQVKLGEYMYNNRRCIRIETARTERVEGCYCYRSVLYVDCETKLPMRTENYDWPRAGGPSDGELIEMFSYIDLRVNVGLSDQDFNK